MISKTFCLLPSISIVMTRQFQRTAWKTEILFSKAKPEREEGSLRNLWSTLLRTQAYPPPPAPDATVPKRCMLPAGADWEGKTGISPYPSVSLLFCSGAPKACARSVGVELFNGGDRDLVSAIATGSPPSCYLPAFCSSAFLPGLAPYLPIHPLTYLV